MEKKTKKMTKAEAFEYLKDKKIRCCGKGRELQEKLFSLGFDWRDGSHKVYMIENVIIVNRALTYTIHYDAFVNATQEELAVEDVLAIELVPEDPEVSEEESFSYEEVIKLAQPLMNYLCRAGATERICITKMDIVSEPMPTLLYGDTRGIASV